MIAEVAAAFAAPLAVHRPMVFWVWNGPVTREQIDADIADMREKGLGGFFIHPMGERFRLADFLEGISPPYLSEEYLELVRHAVDRAQQAGLYAWLYDEGGWPSGTAQGKVVEGHPEFQGKVLSVVRAASQDPPPEGLVGSLVLREDEPPAALDPGAPVPSEPGAVTLHFVQKAGGYPVDTMDPAAVCRFIEVTHERYRQSVGDHFGRTVPGIFTDEPRVGGRVGAAEPPWTPRMLEAFQGDHGFDLRPWLPLLFSEEALGGPLPPCYTEANRMAVRVAFFDTWTRLHREAYWDQVNAWCREHHLLHVGHVGGEDNLPDHLAGGFGEFFRTAGTLDVPGVDAIWRQLWPGQPSLSFPRLAASAARQKPSDASLSDWPRSGLALTESFGVYGLGLTYQGMKWVTDYQFVRGVNVMCPMARSICTERGRLYRTMDDMGPGNPLWAHYRGYADYVGRLSVVCRAGDPVANVAVYYPIETFWAGRPGESAASLETVCGLLDDQGLEYDLLGGDALLHAVPEEGLLVTPGAQYELLIVPEASVLRRAVVDRLLDFRRHGGKLVFLGEGPQWVVEGHEACPLGEAVPGLLEGAYLVDLPKEQDRLVEAYGLSSARMQLMRLDGISAGYFGGPWLDRFAGHQLMPGVVLKVPEDNMGPFARLMGLTLGRLRLTPAEPLDGVRLLARVLEQASLHLLVNERAEDAVCRFSLAAEEPLRVEAWDLSDGTRATLAEHEETSEATAVEVTLGPYGSVVLAAVVPESLPDPGQSVPELATSVNLGVVGPPQPVSGSEIRDGSSVPRAVLPVVPPGTPGLEEGRWDLLPGCEDFSGTMSYRLAFEAPADWLERPVVLELQEVRYVAELWVNGQPAGRRLWSPYEFSIAPLLQEGANELVVHVTNTLANQVLRPEVVEEAQARGWWNVYCRRAEPMMRESLPSGMNPAVRLWLGD